MQLGGKADLPVEQPLGRQPLGQVSGRCLQGLPALQQFPRQLETPQVLLQAAAVLRGLEQPLQLFPLGQAEALLPCQPADKGRGQGTIQVQMQVDHGGLLLPFPGKVRKMRKLCHVTETIIPQNPDL